MLSEGTYFIKTNSFGNIFFFLQQYLKILSFFEPELKLKMLALFLSLKTNMEYILNQQMTR